MNYYYTEQMKDDKYYATSFSYEITPTIAANIGKIRSLLETGCSIKLTNQMISDLCMQHTACVDTSGSDSDCSQYCGHQTVFKTNEDQCKNIVLRIGNLIKNCYYYYTDNRSTPSTRIANLYTFIRLRYPQLDDKLVKLFLTTYNNYVENQHLAGVVLVNPSHTKILLVRNVNSHAWSYPKGKIEYGESPIRCAIRECYEETGINLANYNLFSRLTFMININDTSQNRSINRTVYLYITEIPDDIVFGIRDHFEIELVDWHNLDSRALSSKKYNMYINRTIGHVVKTIEECDAECGYNRLDYITTVQNTEHNGDRTIINHKNIANECGGERPDGEDGEDNQSQISRTSQTHQGIKVWCTLVSKKIKK